MPNPEAPALRVMCFDTMFVLRSTVIAFWDLRFCCATHKEIVERWTRIGRILSYDAFMRNSPSIERITAPLQIPALSAAPPDATSITKTPVPEGAEPIFIPNPLPVFDTLTQVTYAFPDILKSGSKLKGVFTVGVWLFAPLAFNLRTSTKLLNRIKAKVATFDVSVRAKLAQ